jgi:hypothetical protein
MPRPHAVFLLVLSGAVSLIAGDARTAIGYLLPVARLTVVELPAEKP